MSKLVTSLRTVERGAHVEVSIWVHHALTGTLRMGPEEAERFRALLERAERMEKALEDIQDLGCHFAQWSEAHQRRRDCGACGPCLARYVRAGLAAAPDARPSRPPDSFWRSVPCGHPPDPVGWQNPEGLWACHCGGGLDPARALPTSPGGPSPLVSCGKCGCIVLLAAAPGEGVPS